MTADQLAYVERIKSSPTYRRPSRYPAPDRSRKPGRASGLDCVELAERQLITLSDAARILGVPRHTVFAAWRSHRDVHFRDWRRQALKERSK